MRRLFLFFLLPIYVHSQSDDRPNRLSIGPDIFYRDFHEKLPSPLKSDEYGPFYGLVAGYEYKRSRQLYAGLDVAYSFANAVYDGSITNFSNGSWEVFPKRGRSRNQILNVEARLGYTFVAKDLFALQLSPYFGAGYARWARKPDYKEIYTWEYLAVGLLTTYDVNRIFNLGLNLKVMRMVNAMMKIDGSDLKASLSLGNRMQYGLELPMVFSLDKQKIWDIRFIPYYYQKNIGQSSPKTVDGQRIVEPSSRTFLVGSRLEISASF